MSATNASKHGTARCARRSQEGADVKIFICMECGEGCELVVGEEAKKPIGCPYGFTRDETNWKEH